MDDNFEKRKNLILSLLKDDIYVPMRRRELAMFMQVSDEDRPAFDRCLEELINTGKIDITKRGKLVTGAGKPMPVTDTLTGIYRGNQRGFGFVTVEGYKEDFFIPEGQSLNAFNDDTVEIRPETGYVAKDKRREARIIKIVSRGAEEFVGTYEASRNFGFVVLDNSKYPCDIFIPSGKAAGAVSGSKVVVRINDYGDGRKNPEGEVIRILGNSDDPGVDILSIITAFGINAEFPEKVLNQAEKANKPVSPADIEGREDFRSELIITIDGDDSKDLDDAVSLIKEDGLYVLGVHIADVSNYVQEGSAIDREAVKRGTSVYPVDRVVPMLPKTLSNGICSLNEGEDRLTLSCIMKFDDKGVLKDYKITESVINSKHRMTYNEVKRIIEDKDEETCQKYADTVPMLESMQELSLILRNKRELRGAVDFDLPETKIKLDDKGEPIEIKPYERNEATKLIESFMLAANETVAEHYYWREIPFLYRIHTEPDEEKLKKLATFIRNFGLHIKGNGTEVHPKEFQKLLSKIQGSEAESLISRLVLRSMQQAKYSPDCEGHFGLACDYYTHFTSPIRRYPDLQIHRIIKDDLRGRLSEEKIAHYASILPGVADSSSRMERRAEECERETVKLKKARYMQRHIGDIFEGVISGVTNWGIYVELENTVEGMVHVSSLTGDYYVYDENRYELVGERTGKAYRLGEKIKILVKNVDITMKAVDFIIADFEEGSAVHDFYKNGRSVF